MFATNTKSCVLGKIGSSLGDFVLGSTAGYIDRIMSLPTAYYWPMFTDKSLGTTEVSVVPGAAQIFATYHGTVSDASSYVLEGATVFASGGYMTSDGGGSPFYFNISRGTVEFWCNITSNPVTGVNKGLMFGLVDGSSAYDKVVQLNSAGTITFSIQQVSTNSVISVTSSAAMPLGRWNHIACVQDSVQGLSIYINGVLSNNNGNTSASRVNLTSGMWFAGTNNQFGFVDVPGTYSNLALYETGSTPYRVTQPMINYLAGSTGSGGNARVTQAVVEVLRDASGRTARVTQSAIEVLRASAVGFTYTVTAASGFTAHAATSRSRDAVASASSMITITPVTTGLDAHNYSVAAASAILVSPTCVSNRLAVASAASALTLTAASSEVRDAIVSASSHVTVSSLGSANGAFGVSASSMLTFDASSSSARDVFGVSTSAILLSPVASAAAYYAFSVAAASGLTISATSSAIPTTHILVSATTAFTVGPTATAVANRIKSASSRIVIGQLTLGHKDPSIATEGSLLLFTATATATAIGPRSVSASSGIVIGGDAEEDSFLIVRVAASSQVILDSSGVLSFGFAVHATSGFTVSSALKGGRDIHVSAVTSMNFDPGPDSNLYFYLEAEGSIALHQLASVAVGGILAGTRFKITDLAFATILLPWRFHPLPLPPGGGLPHS